MRKIISLQHINREKPSLFKEVAISLKYDFKIVRLDHSDPLPELDKEDTLLVLGGPMGVGDLDKENYSFLRDEVNYIKKALDKGCPLIGVCLGAQLISYACGGDISEILIGDPPSPTKEIGWSEVYLKNNILEKNSPLYKIFPLNVLHWHSDRIILPSHAKCIASSNLCKEQLFIISDNIFGIQFHVEIEEADLIKWCEEDFDFISSIYGQHAKKIINQQSSKYLDSTRSKRIEFIKFLYKSTDNKRN